MKQPAIPNEVWLEIQKFLPLPDLMALSCTSKVFRNIAVRQLFKSITIHGHIGYWGCSSPYDVAMTMQVRPLKFNEKKAIGLKKFAHCIHELRLVGWVIPTNQDPLVHFDEWTDDVIQSEAVLRNCLDELLQTYDTIIQAAEKFNLRSVDLLEATITERLYNNILCKPSLKSVKMNSCQVHFLEPKPLRLSSFQATSSFSDYYLDEELMMFPILNPEQHMTDYLPAVVPCDSDSLRSLSIRADFLPNLSWDPMVPQVLFPQLEKVEIYPSRGKWSWETIQALLLSPQLKHFTFDAIAWEAPFNPFIRDEYQAGLSKFERLPSHVLLNLESISVYGQLFKYLPLTSKMIKQVTYQVITPKEMDNSLPLGPNNFRIEWTELENCAVRLKDAGGSLTQFSIIYAHQLSQRPRFRKHAFLPAEILSRIGQYLPHIVKLHIPELDIVKGADSGKPEALPILLRSLTSFPALEYLVVSAIASNIAIQSWNPPRWLKYSTTSSAEYSTRIHGTLRTIMSSYKFLWTWKDDKWAMYESSESDSDLDGIFTI